MKNNINYDKVFSSVGSIEIQKQIDLYQATEPESDSVIYSGRSPTSVNWNKLVVASIKKAAKVNPYTPDLPVGSVVPSVEAVNWSGNGDIRPRLWDDSSGQFRLIDSGSMITATKKLPSDKEDKSLKLIAVNGSPIKTYGVRELNIKINRKQYKMPAVICDVSQDILGADFLNKYKLGFEWDDFDQSELYITDKRAKIKSLLQVVTVPPDIQRVSYLESSRPSSSSSSSPPLPDQWRSLNLREPTSNEAIAFQIACMKKLELSEKIKPESKSKKDPEEALKEHSEYYAEMIKRFPQLLNPSFSKEAPAHGVYHYLDTKDHAPCRAKRRPLIADRKKAAMGKEIWEQMERDGIIERVKPGANTDWTSALHLANKPGGGVRPCSDFRALNKLTVLDSYNLPLIRDFSSKIYGAKVFSRVDLRSAFFNIPLWPGHKHKTTTLDPWGGTFVYNRLAFGLASAPASWQKLLDHVLKDIKNTFVYLDDILCWGETQAEHDQVLEQVFGALSDNKMSLSLEKCIFGQSEVEYLGYMVTGKGLRPLPKKLDALKNFKEPQSQKDVLHFCGALNYFRTSLKGIKRGGKLKSAA